MNLLTPNSAAAWQSLFTELTPFLANLSISHRQGRPSGCITFQSSFRANLSQKREERIEKVLKREIGIDLIRYTAVSKFGHARRLDTLKWKEERRGSVGGL